LILILGGTSDTHELVKDLSGEYLISVATEYGFQSFSLKYGNKVIHQRFTSESLQKFIKENHISEIIDTTHPYAAIITETAVKAAKETGIKYTNRMRQKENLSSIEYKKIIVVSAYEEAVEIIQNNNYKNVLLTTGSNNINKFKAISEICWARVLPAEESIRLCTEAGFSMKRIIAMQGPFSEDFNTALMKEKEIDCLVTKNSGKQGGLDEKIKACMSVNATCLVID